MVAVEDTEDDRDEVAVVDPVMLYVLEALVDTDDVAELETLCEAVDDMLLLTVTETELLSDRDCVDETVEVTLEVADEEIDVVAVELKVLVLVMEMVDVADELGVLVFELVPELVSVEDPELLSVEATELLPVELPVDV